jgi:hypothetical protein
MYWFPTGSAIPPKDKSEAVNAAPIVASNISNTIKAGPMAEHVQMTEERRDVLESNT